MKILLFLFLTSLTLGQLGGFSPWPGVVIYIHDVLLLVLLIVGGIRLFRRKIKIPKLRRNILFFVFVAFLSLGANIYRFSLPDLSLSGLYLVRWILYALVYFLVIQEFFPAAMWLLGLYSVGVAVAALGLVQFFLYPDLRNLSYLGWDPHFYRLFSTFLDPNFAGIFFVLTLLLGALLWKKNKKKWIFGFGQIIAFAALLLTYSRSSYAAFAGAAIFWIISKKQWKLLIGILLFGLVIFFLPRTPGSTLSLFREQSSLARIGNWQESIGLIAQAPVFGYGFDTLRYVTGQFRSKAGAGLDSSILFVAATTGIVGLFAYGYLIYAMVKMGSKSVFYLASLVALGVHSVFINSAFYPWVMIWMWIITGVVELTFGR